MNALEINQASSLPLRTFGELTAAEQCELVGAYEQGHSIEMYLSALNEFHWTRKPMWLDDMVYRVEL
jgi:hypothetical protein